MSPSFVILFTLLVAFATTINAQLCGKNQQWVECGSGCPEKTCQTRNRPDPRICPAVCRIGCVCAPNYVRLSSRDDTCVLATNCPRNKNN